MESDSLLMTAYSGATNLRFIVFIAFIGVLGLFQTSKVTMRTSSIDTGNSSALDARSNAADPTVYS